jgi:hypothetical protein
VRHNLSLEDLSYITDYSSSCQQMHPRRDSECERRSGRERERARESERVSERAREKEREGESERER